MYNTTPQTPQYMFDERDIRPGHMIRQTWNPKFNITYPEDVSLAISQEVDRTSEVCQHVEEIYSRFYQSGMIDAHNHECILMSCVLRRILRLHGHQASIKQMILYYDRSAKGQVLSIGLPKNQLHAHEIDLHVVVVCEGLIIDFAASAVMSTFGVTAPRAFIASADSAWINEYQDLGELHGKACWTPSFPTHPMLKHWRYAQKQQEIDLAKGYFEVFDF